jgi:hypothetical protein
MQWFLSKRFSFSIFKFLIADLTNKMGKDEILIQFWRGVKEREDISAQFETAEKRFARRPTQKRRRQRILSRLSKMRIQQRAVVTGLYDALCEARYLTNKADRTVKSIEAAYWGLANWDWVDSNY